MVRSWIPIDRIEPFIRFEGLFVSFTLGGSAWLLYHLFLKNVSASRHVSMRRRFLSLLSYFVAAVILGASYWALQAAEFEGTRLWRYSPYLALLSMLTGAALTVRMAQLYVYLYLFRVNMSVGVPRLIVNLFTLAFATLVFCWLASAVFGIQLAPLLATSAVFSIILGLALQDTLGNLFSGVALQLDRPYGIGDWIEVQHGDQKWVGQITEITWRATLLIGFMDELISIPNRTVAQSEVVLFSHSQLPARRSQAFRFPFDAPIHEVRELLLESLKGVPHVLETPAPRILITENAESWLVFKVFYSVSDFGAQYRIGDQIIAQVMEGVRTRGLVFARPAIEVRGQAGKA